MAAIKQLISKTFYTKQHLWIRTHAEYLTIGLTEHGQYLLGEVQYVGVNHSDIIRAHQTLLVIETNKAAVEYSLPFDVKSMRANDALNHSPQRVNESPEEKGWLCRCRTVSGQIDQGQLITESDYDAWLDG